MAYVLIVNGHSYGAAIEGLFTPIYNHIQFFRDPEKFDLVLFTGGEDISPELYGETSPKNMCSSNIVRDKEEITVFEYALKHKVKMAGICRGLQFLTVMCDGGMMHNIGGHAGVVSPFGN